MAQKDSSNDLDSALANGCVADLMAGLEQRAFSATELTDACIAKADAAKPLNSLITLCDEDARGAAQHIDEARASNQTHAQQLCRPL